MQPNLELNYVAVFVAAIVSMALGFVWYGPLFGKLWQRLSGMGDAKPTAAAMRRGIILSAVGALLLSYVFVHDILIWMPSTWSPGASDGGPAWQFGMMAASFTWIGFFVPVLLTSVGWEGKPWRLFFLNAAYHLVSLQLMGQILANWR